MATFVFASNLRKSDFKIINNMQWLNSFAFDNKRRSCTRSPLSWTQKHVDLAGDGDGDGDGRADRWGSWLVATGAPHVTNQFPIAQSKTRVSLMIVLMTRSASASAPTPAPASQFAMYICTRWQHLHSHSNRGCPVTATYNSQIQIQTIERHF